MPRISKFRVSLREHPITNPDTLTAILVRLTFFSLSSSRPLTIFDCHSDSITRPERRILSGIHIPAISLRLDVSTRGYFLTAELEMSNSNHRSSQRSSSSPFRSRKALLSLASATASSGSKLAARPTTPSSVSSSSGRNISSLETSDPTKAKENVTVTIRFRPLRYDVSIVCFYCVCSVFELLALCELYSAREISKGDEIAWYADGDFTVRNEFNASVGYSFGRFLT